MSNLKKDLEDFKNTPEGFKKLKHPWALKVLYPSAIVIFVLILILISSPFLVDNSKKPVSSIDKSKSLVSPIGMSKAEVARCLGFLTEVYRVEGNLKNGQNKFIETHNSFLLRIQTIMNKLKKESWVHNHRVEDIKNLMSNYSEIEKELYYNSAVGQTMYGKLDTTQKGVMKISCSVFD